MNILIDFAKLRDESNWTREETYKKLCETLQGFKSTELVNGGIIYSPINDFKIKFKCKQIHMTFYCEDIGYDICFAKYNDEEIPVFLASSTNVKLQLALYNVFHSNLNLFAKLHDENAMIYTYSYGNDSLVDVRKYCFSDGCCVKLI